MRMQTSGTVALPGRHCWLVSLLHTDLYSQNFIYIVQSRLPVHENWKRGDSNPSLCGMVHASCPVVLTYQEVVRCVRW